jgi:hypothetical protein
VLLEADDKRCVYCECFEWEEKRGKERDLGGQRNDFRKQKLKGFSFVRISEEKMFSRIEFSDDI